MGGAEAIPRTWRLHMATTANDLAKALKNRGAVTSITQGREVIKALVEDVTAAVAAGETVRIAGLGDYKVKDM